MLEVLEHGDRSLAESAYCPLAPKPRPRPLKHPRTNSESCICTEVADVINLPGSTKCRLRGELRRRISPAQPPIRRRSNSDVRLGPIASNCAFCSSLSVK
jgi:hypothetical protein